MRRTTSLCEHWLIRAIFLIRSITSGGTATEIRGSYIKATFLPVVFPLQSRQSRPSRATGVPSARPCDSASVAYGAAFLLLGSAGTANEPPQHSNYLLTDDRSSQSSVLIKSPCHTVATSYL